MWERLDTAVVQRVGDPERVTSIVTAHAPGPELVDSIRSLAAQTWTNHEILLIDDGSPHGHDDVFRAATALDPRVRVLRLDAGGEPGSRRDVGTYAARNAGLAVATGAYVTFQEAGAWSHPTRLERQVAALRAEPGLAGVRCAAQVVTPELIVVRPAPGPMMLRRGAGLFDVVRHGGDDELAHRLDVRQVDEVLTLLLPGPGAGHLEPALRAYRSAYRRPTARPHRPWPLLERTGRRAVDVLLVADWTRPDAGLGQLRALQARDLRVALLHLDDPAHARPDLADLDPAVQDAVNDGTAELVDLTDDVRARLVVVRDPAVLADPPGVTSGLRATRVIIESAVGVTPRRTSAACERLFGAEPLWAPPGPSAREGLAGLPVTALDVPVTVEAADWRLDRRDRRSGRPVAGRRCTGARGDWQRTRAQLPRHPQIDVRLLTGSSAVRGREHGWLVCSTAETSVRCFLHQVDFYLPLPGDDAPADPDPQTLTAMAAGCVVVLPPRYADAFGDAAVYGEPGELDGTIRALHGHRAALVAQRDRARAFVRDNHHHGRYADRILALTP